MEIEMILYHPDWDEIKHYSAEKHDKIKIKSTGDDGIIKFLDYVNRYIDENGFAIEDIMRETLTITIFIKKERSTIPES